MDQDNAKSQMRKGILEYCVLLFLSVHRAYPSDILAKLKDAKLIVVEGTLYTLLNRLKKENKLSYVWEESPKGPPRKYFFITPVGRLSLATLAAEWEEISSTVKYFQSITSNTETQENEKDN